MGYRTSLIRELALISIRAVNDTVPFSLVNVFTGTRLYLGRLDCVLGNVIARTSKCLWVYSYCAKKLEMCINYACHYNFIGRLTPLHRIFEGGELAIARLCLQLRFAKCDVLSKFFQLIVLLFCDRFSNQIISFCSWPKNIEQAYKV